MTSPFPGMNPYLENSDLWSEVHHRLITAIADDISSHLSEKYRVAIEKRIEIKEGYLEIREVSTGRVITVIELLFPTNKLTKNGRSLYLKKREQILGSDTNLVEIDLIRSGEIMPIIAKIPNTDYRILVIKSHLLPSSQLFAFTIRESIPNFPTPLQKGEGEIEVNLQNLLLGIYQRARFDLTLNYHQKPVPDLLEKDREWMEILLKEKGKMKK